MASQLTRAEIFTLLCNNQRFRDYSHALAYGTHTPDKRRMYCNTARGVVHPNSGECSDDELNTWLNAVADYYVTTAKLAEIPMTSLDQYHNSNIDLVNYPHAFWNDKCNKYKKRVTGSTCGCNSDEIYDVKDAAWDRQMDFDFSKSAGSDQISGSANPAGFQGDLPSMQIESDDSGGEFQGDLPSMQIESDDSGGDSGGGRRRRKRPKTRKHRRKKKLIRRKGTKRK